MEREGIKTRRDSLGEIIVFDWECGAKQLLHSLHLGSVCGRSKQEAVDKLGHLVERETAARVLAVAVDSLPDGVVVEPVVRVGFDRGAAEVVGIEDAGVEVLDPAAEGCRVGCAPIYPRLWPRLVLYYCL